MKTTITYKILKALFANCIIMPLYFLSNCIISKDTMYSNKTLKNYVNFLESAIN